VFFFFFFILKILASPSSSATSSMSTLPIQQNNNNTNNNNNNTNNNNNNHSPTFGHSTNNNNNINNNSNTNISNNNNHLSSSSLNSSSSSTTSSTSSNSTPATPVSHPLSNSNNPNFSPTSIPNPPALLTSTSSGEFVTETLQQAAARAIIHYCFPSNKINNKQSTIKNKTSNQSKTNNQTINQTIKQSNKQTNKQTPIDEYQKGFRDTVLEVEGIVQYLVESMIEGKLEKGHTQITLNDIEKSEIIAEGSTAKVYKAKYQGQLVALKEFRSHDLPHEILDFKREIAIMRFVKKKLEKQT